ncbi:DNA/RNA helicase domain-containing protein [Psychrobacillus sp. L3]|uniref:DNA/RNA helicase domain-containing protein n=1 Tax=Psychrobacillus sp. L3 TaxID=3236891 RepID=UPI0036F36CC7
MIIYESTKEQFVGDIVNELLIDRLYNSYQEKIGRTSKAEIRSWENSLQKMSNVMQDGDIPNDASVAIEFNIPNTSMRVDFLIAGNDGNQDHVVIVELKQWESVEKIATRDGIVKTFVGKANRETTHPSYQAWSYAALIEDFNENVQKQEIQLKPCAYLHNYRKVDNDPLTDAHYGDHLEKAPVFTKGEIEKLRSFIKKFIKIGDQNQLLYQIENGRIRPSKSLQDALNNMLKGNEEFIMIDEQKVFFEEAFHQAMDSVKTGTKQVMIVQGGPGTGKSVLAINLLVKLIDQGLVAMYVTKNSAPRNIYSAKLKGDFKKAHIDNLFKGSGSFTEVEENEFDVLIVDEAHRLNEKSGMFRNKGENQIKELIKGSKFTIFFIDENQKVTLSDIGSVDLIKHYAEQYKANIISCGLTSQFRCDGSDGYIAWLDDVLQIRNTANMHELGMDYDVRLFENPNEMLAEIEQFNRRNNKSHVMAGYCWEWPKQNRQDVNHHDIAIPEHDFGISWNIENTWAIENSSVKEAGCIHTAQGLEFDYVGVIIGDDMRFENGKIITDYTKRAKTDQSLKGIKKIAKEDPEEAHALADPIIRNTYRKLMTRGQKGCFVFCTDSALQEYLKERLKKVTFYRKKRQEALYLVDERERYEH